MPVWTMFFVLTEMKNAAGPTEPTMSFQWKIYSDMWNTLGVVVNVYYKKNPKFHFIVELFFSCKNL